MEDLIFQEQVSDWCTTHGLLMMDFDERTGKASSKAAPVTLQPSFYPASLFEQVKNLSQDFNLLIHNVASRPEFLLENLRSVTDSFTQSLLNVLKEVEKFREEKPHLYQPLMLGIYRSDYMLDYRSHGTDEKISTSKGEHQPLYASQVEINTIASSFSNISVLTGRLHSFLAHRYPTLYAPFLQPDLKFAENPGIQRVPEALAQAVTAYGKNNNAVVLMIVHPNERNRVDQRWIEYELWERFQIMLIRKSLADVLDQALVNEKNELTLDDREVAVVYFRAGYGPDDYPSKKEWDGRMILEKSRAIKCPSVATHLTGCKKMQQLLAQRQVLTQFLDDEKQIDRLCQTFTGLYNLDPATNSEQQQNDILKMACDHPAKYVLKPQREGGGNNIYNEQIPPALAKLEKEKDLSSWILMDRIFPPSSQQVFFRNGNLTRVESISELGIFSSCLAERGKGKPVLLNDYSGYLLRTKSISENEGGVNQGASAVDSICLDLKR